MSSSSSSSPNCECYRCIGQIAYRISKGSKVWLHRPRCSPLNSVIILHQTRHILNCFSRIKVITLVLVYSLTTEQPRKPALAGFSLPQGDGFPFQLSVHRITCCFVLKQVKQQQGQWRISSTKQQRIPKKEGWMIHLRSSKMALDRNRARSSSKSSSSN